MQTSIVKDEPVAGSRTALLVIALLAVDGLHFVFARALHDYLPPVTGAMFVLMIASLEVAIFAIAKRKFRISTFVKHARFFLTIAALVAFSTAINYTAVGFVDPRHGCAALADVGVVWAGLRPALVEGETDKAATRRRGAVRPRRGHHHLPARRLLPAWRSHDHGRLVCLRTACSDRQTPRRRHRLHRILPVAAGLHRRLPLSRQHFPGRAGVARPAGMGHPAARRHSRRGDQPLAVLPVDAAPEDLPSSRWCSRSAR